MVKPVPATILPVIVGTAGHVDHGKSALVQLLTGCVMDRHPEARKRGLTIDLGFAACHLPGNRLVGIVDVPGHEDFIRNMVAGAASIDVLMLIVAADDGVMPQTREHLKIVRLLRMPRVMVVITKIDLVDVEMRELVEDDVRTFLASEGYGDAPVVSASNITAEGLGDVRRILDEQVAAVTARPDPRAFRMSVERRFSVKGYGSVVAGIPSTGAVAIGEPVVHSPRGTEHVIRAVQSYKMEADTAPAHVCTAINVRDLDLDEVRRGDSLIAPEVYSATSGALVHLEHAHASIRMKRNTKVKFHAGTAVVNGSVRLLDVDDLRPGGACFAHVRLDHPLVLAAGDRFVIRKLSPSTTIGGGVVLSGEDYKVKRTNAFLIPRLQKALVAVREEKWLVAAALAGRTAVISRVTARRLTQCTGEACETLLQAACDEAGLVPLGQSAYLTAERSDELAEGLCRRVESYHRANPYAWGMSPDHFCELADAPADGLKALLRSVGKAAGLRMSHGYVAREGFEPSLSKQQLAAREEIMRLVDVEQPPAWGDLKKALKLSEKEMRLLTRLLAEEEKVVRVKNYLFSTGVYQRARSFVETHLNSNPLLELADFRSTTGLSRNAAVALLDHFDHIGLTARVEGGRVLAGT